MRNGWRLGVWVACFAAAVGVGAVAGAEEVGVRDPRGVYFLARIPRGEELWRPLASVEARAAFQKTYGKIIEDARNGSVLDRTAAAALLRRGAEGSGVSVETRRLMLRSVFELAIHAGVSPAQLEVDAGRALDALQEQTLETAAERLTVLRAMAGLSPQGKRFMPANMAEEYFVLAELRLDAGMAREAAEGLKEGMQWVKKDAAADAKMKAQVEGLATAIAWQVSVEDALRANANDPEANEAKAFELLLAAKTPAEAALYLAKCASSGYRQLGAALRVPAKDAEWKLTAAQAAMEALIPGDYDQAMTLLYVATSLAREAKGGGPLSAEQRARADMLAIKAEQAAGSIRATRVAAPAQFYGIGLEAPSVVLIIDHSGSMLDNFEFVKRDASVAVKSLDERQTFSVIVVSDHAEFLGEHLLLRATEGAKKSATEALKKVRAEGQNDNLLAPFQDAFEKAFALKPQAIVFLTDGRFGEGLGEAIKKLNVDKQVRIHTVAFVTEEESYKRQLEELARDNGGQYRFVPEGGLSR